MRSSIVAIALVLFVGCESSNDNASDSQVDLDAQKIDAAEPDVGTDARGVDGTVDGSVDPDACVPLPRGEVCNGVDDDCDGVTDEALIAPGCEQQIGVCAGSRRPCVEGAWIDCDYAATVDGFVAEEGANECDGLDNDCDGSADESCGCQPGDTVECGTAEGACVLGVQVCEDGHYGGCQGAVGPTNETCNGVDEDCDGNIDEGTQNACGECGEVGDEICNGIDDDCDGRIDEIGAIACDTGMPGVCGPGEVRCIGGVEMCVAFTPAQGELCDGIDDDCDGIIDELPIQACRTGLMGACAEGRFMCEDGETVCAPFPEPSGEICNSVDDDCDGQIDELPQEVCELPVGGCGAGHTVCEGGVSRCIPDIVVSPEVCNGLDDDCDGITDEVPAQACLTGAPGRCNTGQTQCVGGALACAPVEPAIPEICNGLDDDCDGTADEDARRDGCDTGLDGVCSAGATVCVNGIPNCEPQVSPGHEVLDNQIDDDCDGVVDERGIVLLDLADLAVGGDGVRPGVAPRIYDANLQLMPGEFQAVPFVGVDGIFAPAPIGTTINVAGDQVNFGPVVGSGLNQGSHAKGPAGTIDDPSMVLGFPDYHDHEAHSLLEMHANLGITFDLQAIAMRFGGLRPTRLTGRMGGPNARTVAFVIGTDVDNPSVTVLNGVAEQPLDRMIPPDARYLFLLTTDAGFPSIDERHAYFGDLQLILQ